MKFAVGMNMAIGVWNMIESIGSWLPDPFFDSYEEETLTCRDILNLIADSRETSITITIDRNFLKQIVRSRILHIQALKDKNAY
jgi:hypothetical protein